MIKAAIQSIVEKMLRHKAAAILFFSFLTACFAVVHIYLMFLFGMALGPLLIGVIADPMPPAVSFVAGIIFVILLFVALLKLDDDWFATATYDSKFQGEIPLADAPTTLHAHFNNGVGVGLPADMVILSSASNKLMVKILSVIFLFGPVVLLGSVRGIRESYKLFKVDRRRAAEIIDFIYANKGRVSFDNIMKNLPDVLLKDIDELLLIDGVILLQKELQGLALADSLSEKIRSRCGTSQYDPKQL